MSDETIKTPSTSDNSLTSWLSDIGIKTRVKFVLILQSIIKHFVWICIII